MYAIRSYYDNTREAIELTLHARDAGADAALLISPYYNKPTQVV